MSDDRRAKRKEALAKLDRALRAEGAALPTPRAGVAHAGFEEGETYVNPPIGRGVTIKYPILEDPEIPGRYTISSNPRENKVELTLQASDGRAVAYIYCKYDDPPAKQKTEQSLRVYNISEGSVKTPAVVEARSKLNMRRFASTVALLMRKSAQRVTIHFKSALPGEYI
jgi:hypothetical protein